MQSLLDAAAAQSAADEADAAAARSTWEHSKPKPSHDCGDDAGEGPDEDRNELEKELERGPLRRGKWNRAEEAYALKLIEEFHAGHLPLKEGTTLRAFLSGVLRCQPMRVSKKFVGDWAVGRRAFRRANGATRSAEESAKKMTEIKKLEDAFLASLKRENAKKVAKQRVARNEAAVKGTSQDEAQVKKKRAPRRKMKESNSSSSTDSDASATSMGLMMLGRKPSQKKPLRAGKPVVSDASGLSSRAGQSVQCSLPAPAMSLANMGQLMSANSLAPLHNGVPQYSWSPHQAASIPMNVSSSFASQLQNGESHRNHSMHSLITRLTLESQANINRGLGQTIPSQGSNATFPSYVAHPNSQGGQAPMRDVAAMMQDIHHQQQQHQILVNELQRRQMLQCANNLHAQKINALDSMALGLQQQHQQSSIARDLAQGMNPLSNMIGVTHLNPTSALNLHTLNAARHHDNPVSPHFQVNAFSEALQHTAATAPASQATGDSAQDKKSPSSEERNDGGPLKKRRR
mmetsp:Transcript_1295/g.3059  ORF Transcript_1295/g.3059 Transcript_1295/m.3059 type:complete len:517 (+) Transcript_1295:139-1689(+)